MGWTACLFTELGSPDLATRIMEEIDGKLSGYLAAALASHLNITGQLFSLCLKSHCTGFGQSGLFCSDAMGPHGPGGWKPSPWPGQLGSGLKSGQVWGDPGPAPGIAPDSDLHMPALAVSCLGPACLAGPDFISALAVLGGVAML